MLETAASSTLLPCENWVLFQKVCFPQIIVFIAEKGTFCFKYAFLGELTKHMYLLKGNHLCYQQEHLQHYFPVRTEFFKGILPVNDIFQGGDRLCLLQRDLSSWVEEKHASHQRKPSVLEAAASIILFPVRTELVFEGVLPANQSLKGWEWLILLPIGLFCWVD
jgi:hypothetical protein